MNFFLKLALPHIIDLLLDVLLDSVDRTDNKIDDHAVAVIRGERDFIINEIKKKF